MIRGGVGILPPKEALLSTKSISCPVETEDSYGVYANAFRVMQDGSDAVLDFCVFSEQDNAAKTVSRVRVPPSFLSVILSRLRDAVEVTEPDGTTTLYVMPEVTGLN